MCKTFLVKIICGGYTYNSLNGGLVFYLNFTWNE